MVKRNEMLLCVAVKKFFICFLFITFDSLVFSLFISIRIHKVTAIERVHKIEMKSMCEIEKKTFSLSNRVRFRCFNSSLFGMALRFKEEKKKKDQSGEQVLKRRKRMFSVKRKPMHTFQHQNFLSKSSFLFFFSKVGSFTTRKCSGEKKNSLHKQHKMENKLHI